MFGEPIRHTFDALFVSDPVVATHQELERIVTRTNEVRAWLDALDIKVARRAKDLAGSSPAAAGANATDTLAAGGRRSRRESRAASERSGVCDRMPGFEAALAEGEVSAGHLDALANATRNLDDATKSALDGYVDDLLDAAKTSSVEAFEREVRDIARLLRGDGGKDELSRQKNNANVKKWIDHHSGMWKLFAELDPETGAKVFAALDTQLRSVTKRDGNAGVPLERLAVDALVEIVTGSRTGEPRLPEVIVHVDIDTLVNGLHEHSLCEYDNGVPLPAATVRRMCCEAAIVPMVLDGRSGVLDAGHERRTANRSQRRALRSLYRTCGHPGCDVPFEYCHMHHVEFWENLGLTDLFNLLPLCTKHHHLVHEGGWTLTMSPDRVITLKRPDGTVQFHGDTTDRQVAGRATVTAARTACSSAAATGSTGAGASGTTMGCRPPRPPGGPPGPDPGESLFDAEQFEQAVTMTTETVGTSRAA